MPIFISSFFIEVSVETSKIKGFQAGIFSQLEPSASFLTLKRLAHLA